MRLPTLFIVIQCVRWLSENVRRSIALAFVTTTSFFFVKRKNNNSMNNKINLIERNRNGDELTFIHHRQITYQLFIIFIYFTHEKMPNLSFERFRID